MAYKLEIASINDLKALANKLFAAADRERMQWLGLFNTAYTYVLPNKNQFYEESVKTKGTQKDLYVYDSTAIIGVKHFVSKVQQLLFPSQSTWLTQELQEKEPDPAKAENETEEQFDFDDINKRLSKRNKQVFHYINNSNFELAMHESLHELAIGTGVIQVRPGDRHKPLEYISIPINEVYINAWRNGFTQAIWRKSDTMTISEIEALWPKADLTQIRFNTQDPSLEVLSVIEGEICVEIKPTLAGVKKRYIYLVMIQSEIVFQEERSYSPWVVFRWRKLPNESYGRGAVLDCLSAILTVNQICKYELSAAALAISPPFMGFGDGIFNPFNFNLQPNTFISVAPTQSGSWPIAQLPVSNNLNFAQLQIQDYRAQINNALFVQPLGQIDAPPKTATEVAYRQRQLAEQIGGSFPRLLSECAYPIFEKSIEVLEHKGLIEKLIIPSDKLETHYVSPIARAENLDKIQSFTNFLQIMHATVGPEKATLSLDMLKLPYWLGENSNLDKELLKNRAQLEAELQNMAQMQATELQGLQDAQQAAAQPSLPQGSI